MMNLDMHTHTNTFCLSLVFFLGHVFFKIFSTILIIGVCFFLIVDIKTNLRASQLIFRDSKINDYINL
jgi:hypothetical protein